MKSFWLIISTFFNVGYLPLAPGSWASLLTAAVLFLASRWLQTTSFLWLMLATLPVFIIGVYASHRAEKLLGSKDPQPIVIDEVAGQMVALWWTPVTIPAYLAAFLLFRILDIFKPFPINRIDRGVRGGWGIMLDDVLAGLYVVGIMQLFYRIFPHLA
ncbi:MAG: phosphatidylglycerophosphatase A [Acidobacteriota bacterium]|jgi:phosphatidylglycerophosphatase A|nr:phosphatidylglycerophosphatase A [Acidobacteriota bacterium]